MKEVTEVVGGSLKKELEGERSSLLSSVEKHSSSHKKSYDSIEKEGPKKAKGGNNQRERHFTRQRSSSLSSFFAFLSKENKKETVHPDSREEEEEEDEDGLDELIDIPRRLQVRRQQLRRKHSQARRRASGSLLFSKRYQLSAAAAIAAESLREKARKGRDRSLWVESSSLPFSCSSCGDIFVLDHPGGGKDLDSSYHKLDATTFSSTEGPASQDLLEPLLLVSEGEEERQEVEGVEEEKVFDVEVEKEEEEEEIRQSMGINSPSATIDQDDEEKGTNTTNTTITNKNESEEGKMVGGTGRFGNRPFRLSPDSSSSAPAGAVAGAGVGGIGTGTTRSMPMSSSSISSSASSFTYMPSRFRRLVLDSLTMDRLMRIRTAADALPFSTTSIITSNGKIVMAVMLGLWIAMLLCWFPFYLLSYLVTEVGVYLLLSGSIYLSGRGVVRLIAFPGSSHRVYGEIQAEFCRYSLRMLESGLGSVMDVAMAIARSGTSLPGQAAPTTTQASSSSSSSSSVVSGASSMSSSSTYGKNDVQPLWRRARTYRCRVLGMYADVLTCLLEADGDGVAISNNNLQNHDASDNTDNHTPFLTQHGNNRVVGDIGKLDKITPQAKTDGRTVLSKLQRILADLDRLGDLSSPLLNSSVRSLKDKSASPEAVAVAMDLFRAASDLKDFLPSLKPRALGLATSNGEEGTVTDEEHVMQDEDEEDDDDEVSVDAMRRRLQQRGGSTMDVVKSAASSILPMLDPPPHPSIFGLDVLRGCMLSRYKGARQIWIPRTHGGRIDAIHIPSSSPSDQKRAVLYCNPNAGLSEVATGMSLVGGNVPSDGTNTNNNTTSNSSSSTEQNCWTDFYLANGFDVILFNYAGFGRSHGNKSKSPNTPRKNGAIFRFARIASSIFFDFKPTSQSMKTDALTVASHVITHLGLDQLVIHGESIGGMAAAFAANSLTNSHWTHPPPLLLLICDRSFCNLEAVAQRLVGSWSANVIRILTPTWSTDVAGDFLSARCAKVVANDAADAIVANASSLKTGLALAKELRRGYTKNALAWVTNAPLEYRMADWEDVGVSESSFGNAASGSVMMMMGTTAVRRAPVWPADKLVTEEEAFHFAACVRRIGKVATAIKKDMLGTAAEALSDARNNMDEEEGIEITEVWGASTENNNNNNNNSAILNTQHFINAEAAKSTHRIQSPIIDAWKVLACCDGMCGIPLGASVKTGMDSTVSWLCATLTYGGQIVARAASLRLQQERNASNKEPHEMDTALAKFDKAASPPGEDIHVTPQDFRVPRPSKTSSSDDDMPNIRPVPIPEVIATLRRLLDHAESSTNQPPSGIIHAEPEIRYCIDILDYIVSRLSSPVVVSDSMDIVSFRDRGGSSVGRFLDLHCGHNNQYSKEERDQLRDIIFKVCSTPAVEAS